MRESGLCIDINECDEDICKKNEVCENHIGGFDCQCISGYFRDENLNCVERLDCHTQLCANPINECTSGTLFEFHLFIKLFENEMFFTN